MESVGSCDLVRNRGSTYLILGGELFVITHLWATSHICGRFLFGQFQVRFGRRVKKWNNSRVYKCVDALLLHRALHQHHLTSCALLHGVSTNIPDGTVDVFAKIVLNCGSRIMQQNMSIEKWNMGFGLHIGLSAGGGQCKVGAEIWPLFFWGKEFLPEVPEKKAQTNHQKMERQTEN